jgi:hypothetical protein
VTGIGATLSLTWDSIPLPSSQWWVAVPAEPFRTTDFLNPIYADLLTCSVARYVGQ